MDSEMAKNPISCRAGSVMARIGPFTLDLFILPSGCTVLEISEQFTWQILSPTSLLLLNHHKPQYAKLNCLPSGL